MAGCSLKSRMEPRDLQLGPGNQIQIFSLLCERHTEYQPNSHAPRHVFFAQPVDLTPPTLRHWAATTQDFAETFGRGLHDQGLLSTSPDLGVLVMFVDVRGSQLDVTVSSPYPDDEKHDLFSPSCPPSQGHPEAIPFHSTTSKDFNVLFVPESVGRSTHTHSVGRLRR